MKKSLFIFLLLNAYIIYSEEVNPVMKNLLGKSNLELIEIAENDIRKDYPEFDSKNFDEVKVYYQADSLMIHFNMRIKFVPLNSEAYYQASKFYGKTSSLSLALLKNPEEYEPKKETTFFKPEGVTAEKINWIKKIIQKSSMELFENEVLREGYLLEIFENEGFYQIIVDSDFATGRFSLDSKTGEIFNESHKEKQNEKKSPWILKKH